MATYIGSHFAFAGVNAQVSFDFGDYGLGYGRGLGDYGQEDYQLDPTGYYLEQGFGRGMSALSSAVLLSQHSAVMKYIYFIYRHSYGAPPKL